MARKKGSKNKSTLAKELMAAVMAQDEEYVKRENAQVLDVANGTNDSSSSESEFGDDQDSDFEPLKKTLKKILDTRIFWVGCWVWCWVFWV